MMNLEALNASLTAIRNSNLTDSMKLEQIANARTSFVDSFIENLDEAPVTVQYMDREDWEAVAFGKLSLNTACEIAYNRWLADMGNEAELERTLAVEANARRTVGTAPKSSIGPKRQGCKDHGFESIGLAGSGSARYSSLRLHTVR